MAPGATTVRAISGLAFLLAIVSVLVPWETTPTGDGSGYVQPSAYIVGWCLPIAIADIVLLLGAGNRFSKGNSAVLAIPVLWLVFWYVVIGMPVPGWERNPNSGDRYFSWYYLTEVGFRPDRFSNLGALGTVSVVAFWLTMVAVATHVLGGFGSARKMS